MLIRVSEQQPGEEQLAIDTPDYIILQLSILNKTRQSQQVQIVWSGRLQ